MRDLTLEECEKEPLFHWCIDRMGSHLDDIANDNDNNHVHTLDSKVQHCMPLCKAENRLELLEFINSEVQNHNEDDLIKLIDENRRTIISLKKFIEEKNDLASERDYEQMIKVEKKSIQDLILIIILLVIALCFGIYCIYNFFRFEFEKKLIGM
tara:strand:- start:49 stop:510 length:462 start_codon:yes stop_codon:yes gene_type:complete